MGRKLYFYMIILYKRGRKCYNKKEYYHFCYSHTEKRKELGRVRWGQDSRQTLLVQAVQALCLDKWFSYIPFSQVRAPSGSQGDAGLCRG